MSDIYKCSNFGHHTDEPHVITEEEILEDIGTADMEELDMAMESAGAEVCPECFSPDIELHDSL